MLSKSEKKLLKKLTPTIEELLNKEALLVYFCYLDGDNINLKLVNTGSPKSLSILGFWLMHHTGLAIRK